jgi:hypothetical protein
MKYACIGNNKPKTNIVNEYRFKANSYRLKAKAAKEETNRTIEVAREVIIALFRMYFPSPPALQASTNTPKFQCSGRANGLSKIFPLSLKDE